MLTSAARESLRGVETVIVDEVHAVAATKRGAHLALTLERLDALLERPAQRIGLSATVRPVEEVARFLGGSPRGRPSSQPPTTKTIEVEVVVPVEDMAALGERAGPVPGGSRRAPSRGRASGRRSRSASSTWSRRTARRSCSPTPGGSAERLTRRLNEIATERARRPDGRGARPRPRPEGSSGASPAARRSRGPRAPRPGASPAAACRRRRRRRDRPRAPRLGEPGAARARSRRRSRPAGCPPWSRPSSLELGIDMGAVDLVVQVESPPSVASGLQRVGRAGHQVGAVSRGVILPKYRGDLVQCAVVAERMVAGRIEATAYPRNPLDVLAQQVVAMCAMDDLDVDELAALVRRAAPFAGLPQTRARGGARHAVRAATRATSSPSCARASSGTASPARSPAGPARSGSRSPAAAPSPTAACSASSSSARRRAGSASSTRRWSTSRGSATCSSSARAPGGSRTSPTTGCSSRPPPGQPGRLPFWHGDAPGRPVELGPGAGRVPARAVGAGRRRRAERGCATAGLDELRRRPTCSPTSTSSARRPARCPTTARSSSSASATSSATGGSPSTRRSARRSTRRGRWRSPPGCASATASTCRRCTPTTASCCGCPRPRRRRAAPSRSSSPAEVEPAVQAEVGGIGAVRQPLPRVRRRGRCCCPGATPAAARRCGSSASARRSCSRSPRSTAASRSCSRRCARCCRTSSTCPGLVELMRDVEARAVRAGRGGDAAAVAVRPLAAVRLHRRVHVRGRLAAGRAAGAGAVAGQRAARRAARPGRAARAASTPTRSPRSRRSCSGWPRTAGPRTSRRSPTCCACSAT